jgi:peptide deformylase
VIYPITMRGDPILHVSAIAVKDFGPSLKQLVRDMYETMYASGGIGLAAPQVGWDIRLAIIEVPGTRKILVNPTILDSGGEIVAEEGCLSVPDVRVLIARPQWIVVSAQNLSGVPFEMEAENLAARVICHEIDHLNGILITDRRKS